MRFFGSFIENKSVVPALRTILGRVAEIRESGVEQARLNQARWKIARKSHARYLGIDSMLNVMMHRKRMGRPVLEVVSYSKRLAGVKSEHVAALLQPCAGHEVVGVVGHAAVLKEALAELGLPIREVEMPKQDKVSAGPGAARGAPAAASLH